MSRDVKRHNGNIDHADILRPIHSQLRINNSIFLARDHGTAPYGIYAVFIGFNSDVGREVERTPRCQKGLLYILCDGTIKRVASNR